ncbi:MAG: hypothetical protein K8U57_19215 [Planctomycetes bacterium]|nr:hypothetical protein [Planctomycetota bacterium]
MTFIGKVLAVVNLMIGLGILSWSTSVYFQRPSWFDPIAEGGPDRGSDPKTFAQLKQEADALLRVANTASGTWGTNLKNLEALEDRRDKRQAEYAQRLEWAHKGKDGKDAFFKPLYEKDAANKETSVMKLYEIDAAGKYTQVLGEAIVGPDNKPLKGADTLLTNFSGDVKEVQKLSGQIVKHREKYAELTLEIDKDERRLQKMIVIRDAVQGELFYLSSFEVNVYETRETVLRRQKQLVLRLIELGGVGPKK